MSSHTKEPWALSSPTSQRSVRDEYETDFSLRVTAIDMPDQEHLAGVMVWGDTHKKSEETARRIVACVNACAGVSTSDLELAAAIAERKQQDPWRFSHPRLSARIQEAKIPQHYRNIEAQRDALLATAAALVEDIEATDRAGSLAGYPSDTDEMNAMRAVIASVKESK